MYAALIEQGKVPYRDFYLFTQPLSLLVSTFISHFIGNSIILFRAWGILERILLTFLLYQIYKNISHRSLALIASIVSLIFYTGTTTDVIYDYVQTCLVFILLSAYLILNYINLTKIRNNLQKYIILSGLCSGFAFLTKQTLGLIVPSVIFFFLVCFEYARTNQQPFRIPFYYLSAFFLPSIITILVLYHLNALQEYWNQVFFFAAESKGGLVSVFFGSIPNILNKVMQVLSLAILIIVFLILTSKNTLKNIKLNKDYKISILSPIAIVSLALLIFYCVTFFFTAENFVRDIFLKKIIFLYVTYEALILISGYLITKLVTSSLNPFQWQWLFLSLISISIIYALSLSFSYTVASSALGAGLIIILLYSLETPLNKIKKIILDILCIMLISLTLIQHFFWPYDWWGWIAPSVQRATATTQLKPLSGLTMSPYTAKVFSEITAIIHDNTNSNDSIYVFPHMPIFYLLSNRFPNTWAITDYFDVCPDRCAEEDARRLQQSPPKIIIIETFPEVTWQFHELSFRHGKRSGQRKIIEALNKIIRIYAYSKVASYDSTTRAFNIEVWVKS